ncbi:trypsin-like peptidase domain-containing protein [Micromonospora sp. WMMD737]|uniref:nSTAND1 domain-containing NTPase n=1 Tax=Micromonospora sp. WMMD737 TaxID=3404113 RepID=UPI003B950183
MAADERIRASLVRFAGGGGLGFLVAPDLVCTAAHVVTAALVPEEPAVGAEIEIDGLPGCIEVWQPEVDLAGLRLTAPAPPRYTPITLADRAPSTDRRCRMFGFPAGHLIHGAWATGELRGRTALGLLQIDDERDRGFTASQGFSGTPVWDDGLDAAIGVLVTVERQTSERRTSYALPVDAILGHWPALAALRKDANPFRGLSPFREQDERLFHGRDEETAALAAKARYQPFTVLSGASGSGKSSLLAAGVVPRLRRDDAVVATIRAHAFTDPEAALRRALNAALDGPADSGGIAEALDRLGKQRLVLVVDQFEELLDDREQAATLLRRLHDTQAAGPRVRIVVAIRSDFLDQAATLFGSAATWSEAAYPLTPLTGEALRPVIEGPLAGTGRVLDPGLPEKVIADAGTDAAVLPMVEQLMHDLWEDEFTREAYDRVGGVAGVIGGHAERAIEEPLALHGEPAVRRVLLRLVRPVSATATLWRTVKADELTADDLAVVRELADRRLVVAREDGFDLIHDTLVQHWKRLHDWVSR